MIDGIATLGYLEYRRLVHRLEAIRRSPGRSAIWVVWLVGLGILVFVRSRTSRATSLASFGNVHVAALAGGFYLVLLGIFMTNVRRGGVPAFESLAEARFTALSAIPPILVIAWLQIRTSFGMVVRLLMSLAFALLAFAPRGAGSGAPLVRYLLGLFFATLLLAALPFPIALVRGRARTAYRVVGVLVILVGAYVAGREAAPYLAPSVARIAARSPDLGVGAFAVSLVHGAWPPLLVLLAAFLLTVLLAVAVARDAWPELYDMTVAAASHVDIRRGGVAGALARGRDRSDVRFAKGRTNVVTRDERRVPSGAWVLVWRGWIVFRRARGLPQAALGLAFWYALGAAVGTAFANGNEVVQSIIIAVGTMALGLSIIFATVAAQRVALDLRKPIFWLAGPSTYARLIALVAGALWRGTISIGGALGIAFAAAHLTTFALAAPFFTAAVLMLLQTTGFALYALFPAKLDQTGPLAVVRMALTFLAIVVPIAVVGLVVVTVGFLRMPHLHLPLPLVTLAGIFALAATVEAALFLQFAAWRIDATLDAFTRAEV